MPSNFAAPGKPYSPTVGLIYVFNLIVGTGALTMPGAFVAAGWLLGIGFVVVLAFMSYMTTTFVIETMASANAVLRLDKQKNVQDSDHHDAGSIDNDDEHQSLLHNDDLHSEDPAPDLFEITKKVEMGQMVSLFFNKVGVTLFYIAMVCYLYGDMTIYAAAVPKSLRDVVCTYVEPGMECNQTVTGDTPCWPSVPSITRAGAYRIFLASFILLLGPFVFFNIQQLKYLQVFTAIIRWVSFIAMIVLACIQLAKGHGHGHPGLAHFSGIPVLFGICVYSFMCHHSLPSIATPISNKSRIHSLFAADYSLILVFYLLLSLTGVFTFASMKDLYTLNFEPNPCYASIDPVNSVEFISYFLILFPVFALSSNFPIIGITLRENLKMLCLQDGRTYPWIVDRILFPVVTLLPPITVAMVTNNVEILCNYTRGRGAPKNRVRVVGRKGKASAADVTETGFLKAAVGFEIRFMRRTVTRTNGRDVCANFKR
ncbi:hypothetical protein LSAT2_018338 [Lamellibrachia satsuma]|nr:hypothetical protein LSAT2_018338 [Lamellibrachia satsuma]